MRSNRNESNKATNRQESEDQEAKAIFCPYTYMSLQLSYSYICIPLLLEDI